VQGDVGVDGQKLIQTPRLDRMARDGTRYTHAYCGTSLCAPSRTSLMTGLHSGHSPVRGNWEVPVEGQLLLPANTVTVAQVLKSAGYATAVAGKWGMRMFDTTASPLKKGFDHQIGYNCRRHARSYFPTFLYRDGVKFDLPGNDGEGVGPIFAQNVIQTDVLQWVRAQKEKPFSSIMRLRCRTGATRSTTSESTRTNRGVRSQKYSPHRSRASTAMSASSSIYSRN
jgi:arylsulfatase A-like enzyme